MKTKADNSDFFILSSALRGCDVIFVHGMMKESEMMEELSAMHSM